MAVVLAVVVIAVGAFVIFMRERFAADNAGWQRQLFPELSEPRQIKLAGFGFGLFGALAIFAGGALLVMALHRS